VTAVKPTTARPAVTPASRADASTTPDTPASAKQAELAATGQAIEQTHGTDQLSQSRPREVERRELQTFAAHSKSAADTSAATTTSAPPRVGLAKGIHSRALDPGTPTGYAGRHGFDMARAAEVMHRNIDKLDTANGGRSNGRFDLKDMESVAADRRTPPELRKAVRNFLADPTALMALDVASGRALNRRFNGAGLMNFAAEERANAGRMSADAIADVIGQPDNFDRLDRNSAGELDSYFSRADLRRVANDGTAPAALRQASQDLLDNDNRFRAFDLGESTRRDGFVHRYDVDNVEFSPTPERGRQWKTRHDMALQRALADGVDFDPSLFSGVSQTDRGNCVSVAIIKAAMDRYGNGVLKSVDPLDDGGYAVTLQDDEKIQLNRGELEAAATAAHFGGDTPETRAYATLCYAAMGKRAQEMSHENSATYAEGLRALANGEVDPLETTAFLGLRDRTRSVAVADIPGQDGVVAWSNSHAVYVDTRDDPATPQLDAYTDGWGEQLDYDGFGAIPEPGHELVDAFYFE